jgi:hypothetical protein
VHCHHDPDSIQLLSLEDRVPDGTYGGTGDAPGTFSLTVNFIADDQLLHKIVLECPPSGGSRRDLILRGSVTRRASAGVVLTTLTLPPRL